MKILDKVESFENLINNNQVVIFQFGSNSCAPCHAIKNKLDDYSKVNEEVCCVYVPTEKFFQLAAKNRIFTVPTILVYVNKKLTIRESGYFSLEDIFFKVEHYLMILNSVDVNL